jgi:hypothetical protein
MRETHRESVHGAFHAPYSGRRRYLHEREFLGFFLGLDLRADVLGHFQDKGDVAQHGLSIRAKLRARLPAVPMIPLERSVRFMPKILSHGYTPRYVEVEFFSL